MLSLCVMYMHVCVCQDTSACLDSDFGRSLESCILLSPFLILSPSFSFSHESYRYATDPKNLRRWCVFLPFGLPFAFTWEPVCIDHAYSLTATLLSPVSLLPRESLPEPH